MLIQYVRCVGQHRRVRRRSSRLSWVKPGGLSEVVAVVVDAETCAVREREEEEEAWG